MSTTTTSRIACEVCETNPATCRTDATDASPALNRCDRCALDTCGQPNPLPDAGILAQAETVERARVNAPRRAAQRDLEQARRADERVTERDLLRACRRAVDQACRSLSLDEREDLTSELVQAVARKAGTEGAPDWNPPRRLIAHSYLTRRAGYIWARQRERLIAGRADALPSVLDESRQSGALSLNVNGTLEGEDERETAPAPVASILAAAADAAGHPAPAPEHVDAPTVCAALGVSATAADAVRAALSGWGSALDLARALGVSHPVARKRLQRGRDAIRARFPDPRALLAALGDALADAPDPERQAERVRLSAAERAAEDAVTAVRRSGRPSMSASDPTVTWRATRRNMRAAVSTRRYGRALPTSRVPRMVGAPMPTLPDPTAWAPRCAVPALYRIAAERAATAEGRAERRAYLAAVGRDY